MNKKKSLRNSVKYKAQRAWNKFQDKTTTEKCFVKKIQN